MTLQIFAVLVLGLMSGSELNVATFGHPSLNRQSPQVNISVRASLAVLFGRVMPFWMIGSTLINLLLLFRFEHLSTVAWRFDAIAFAIQVFVILFSLIAPVPINNRITTWTPTSYPNDWKALEHRWDLYHWFRTSALVVAFAFLAMSLAAR